MEGATVSQNTLDRNEAAENRTEDTKRFVRQVRAATRRKYTSEEKIRIVLEGFRREGIKPNNFYSGPDLSAGSGQGSWSPAKSVSVETRQEMPFGRRSMPSSGDNTDLKQMVAELSLELHRLKKTAIPMLDEGRTSV